MTDAPVEMASAGGELPAGHEPGLMLPSLAPEVLQPVQRRPGITLLSLAAAVAAHAAAVSFMMPDQSVVRVGAGGYALEAIEVDLVRLDGAVSPAAAQPAPPAVPDPAPRQKDDDDRPDQEATLQAALNESIAEDADRPAAEPGPPPVEPETATSPASDLREAELNASTAPAALALGVARTYAKSVISALAASRPRPRGHRRGTVVIAFVIAPSGDLESSRIVQSSGIPALDESALAALRKTRFPAPPPGATARDLDFQIPYIFR